MPLHRQKKFVRSAEPPANLSITPRDYELLRDIAEYRFMNTEQILALYPTSPRNIRLRLSMLFDAHFLDRPESQRYAPREKQFLIYSLGEKGKELLSRKESVHKNKEVGFPYLAHAMMISRFHATLALALRKIPSQPRIERWVQSYDLKDQLTLRGQSPELVPDAFFTISDKDELLDFFLEADRGSMDNPRMLEKMKTYWRWYRDKRYEKILDVANFRVLTITKGEKRAENLAHTTRKADDKRIGSNMFLFLSEKEFSLASPEAVLSPIWISAKGEKHGILE